ncbi:MAG TPA: TonB-dependent receptor [Myxococcaceae bacterium]|nr:TonB-dependent receptor [Myxococcaceae bacterium]
MERLTLRRRAAAARRIRRLSPLLIAGAVAGAVLASPAALAQASTSVLTGNVVDASTRAPVADVVVTATSPQLQGEQVVVTDSTGLYRIPQLPPGSYTLRFEKETYRPFSRAGIDVAADRTLRLNVELLPEVAGIETVTVVGTPPVVDVGSSTVGTTINSDFVRNLAVSRPNGLGGANRSFDSLASTAPNAANDLYGVAISGSQSPENSYLIDGLAVNDPAYGVNGSPLTVEFIDEVNVITGGYMPEYGRTLGGALSATTKSGGNEFHGSIFGTWTPGSLTGAPGPLTITGGTPAILTSRTLDQVYDLGATLGGYFIKDKLWFFAGFQWASQRYSYNRTYQKAEVDSSGNFVNDPVTGQPVYNPIEGGESRRFGTERTINFIGKLTYLISQDHRLSVSINGTPTTGGGDGNYPLRVPGVLQARNPVNPGLYAGGGFNVFNLVTHDDSYNLTGELNSSFLEKKLLLDVRVGWHHQLDEGIPADGSEFNTGQDGKIAGTPGLITSTADLQNIATLEPDVPKAVKQACSGPFANTECGFLGYVVGGPGFIERLKLDSYQLRAAVTGLVTGLGHHVLKAGFDGAISYYEHTKAYTGKAAWQYLQGNSTPDGQPAINEARRYGYLTGPDQAVTLDSITAKSKSTIWGFFVQDSWSILDKVTLNVGVRYDTLALAGDDGITRIALSDQLSPRIGVVWDPTQQGRSKIYANYGRYYENIPLDIADRELSIEPQIYGYSNTDCDPVGIGGLARCDAAKRLTSGLRPNRKWRQTSADQVPVDPDLKSAANDEIVAGAEYEILANARLGLNYTYRNLVRTVEDMSNDEANTYFIGNPGQGIADTFPKAQRTYHAVTASFVKTFADLWQAQVSYTWSRLTGNYDGLYRPEDGQLDPNLNSTFDLKSLLLNQDGNLSGDITHTIKMYLAKEFVLAPTFSVTAGASFNAASGPPINYLGAQVTYGPGQAYILERGAGGRLPWVTAFDARLSFNFRISKDSTLSASVEGFNLFNSQRAITVDQNYTFDNVGPIINARNGTVPSPYGSVVQVGPSYDPNLTWDQNVAAGNAVVLTPGNGSLPKPKFIGGAASQVLLPTPNQTVGFVNTNTNWGKPTNYQPVRSFRFSLRFTF